MDPRRKLQFRRCLNTLSNQLSRSTLEDMKYVCKDHVPVSRMEKVHSPLDLFQALEERGKLSASDTSFLVKVLQSVGRQNLISDLQRAGFVPQDISVYPEAPPVTGGYSTHAAPQQGPNVEYLFNETLLKIAQNLSAKDVDALAFNWAEPLLQVSSDRISSGTQLFQLLQQRQIVTPTNLHMLYEELHTIGRGDLCKRINNYMTATNQPVYDSSEAAGHVQPIPGINHIITQPTEESHPSYLQPSTYNTPPQTHTPTQPSHPPSSLPPTQYYDHPPSHAASELGRHITTPSDSGASLSGLPSNSTFCSSSTMSSNMTSVGNVLPGGGAYLTAEADAYRRAGEGGGGGGVGGGVGVGGGGGVGGVGVGGEVKRFGGGFEGGGGVKDPLSTIPERTEYLYSKSCSGFTPKQTYPVTPAKGFAIEERGNGQQPSMQSGGSCGLTFNTNEEKGEEEEEEEQSMALAELQELQTKWGQSQEKLLVVEQEKKQLLGQLTQLRENNDRILAEREGESEQHRVNTRDLELALQKKIDEVQMLQDEIKMVQRNLRPSHPTPGVNPDELYKLEKSPHGICLIINNHKFFHRDPQKAHPQRGGAEIDQYNLTQTFRYLRYRVEVEENLTSDQMTDRLMKMSQRDHSGYDSFVCCILSHGEHNIIHGANSEPVNINDLTGIMKFCPTLRTKPKLFFIQCCRGEEEDEGFEKDDPGNSSYRSTIPSEADFFLGFATPLGKAAYRSRKHGSWYISELCKVFTQHGYHSTLSSMMRRVNTQISNAFTKDGYKQCTEFVDRLRKEVHFFYFIRNRGKSTK